MSWYMRKRACGITAQGMATLLVAGIVLISGTPGGATTYVVMSDEALARQAQVIAEVEVTDVLHGVSGQSPTTEYQAIVRRVLKGDSTQSTTLLRVPGGHRNDGSELNASADCSATTIARPHKCSAHYSHPTGVPSSAYPFRSVIGLPIGVW